MSIVSYGVRAYGIVDIADYSDMKYGTGADHLVYGWLFFGVVIMLMFWVGGFFADDMKSVIDKDKARQQEQALNYKMAVPISVLLMLSLTAYIYSNVNSINAPEIPESALQLSDNLRETKTSNWGIFYEDSLQSSHLIDAKNIEIFRAVYANRQNKGELISWKNRAYNTKKWTLINESIVELGDVTAKLLLVRSITGKERSIIYWYKIAGTYFIHPTKAKLQQAIEVYLTPNSESEIMAFSIESSDQSLFINNVKKYLSSLSEIRLKNSIN